MLERIHQYGAGVRRSSSRGGCVVASRAFRRRNKWPTAPCAQLATARLLLTKVLFTEFELCDDPLAERTVWVAVRIGDDDLWEEKGVEEGRVLDGECGGNRPQLRGLGVSGSHWEIPNQWGSLPGGIFG
jgi:hypothetical protein